MLKRMVGYGLRRIMWSMMNAQERRWRRRLVVLFYAIFLLGFVDRAGLDHSWPHDFYWTVWTLPYLLLVALVQWPKMRVMRSLRDLEERSFAMYGVSFKRLTTEQTRAVDRTREAGSSVAYDHEDEFAVSARRRSVESAFVLLRSGLLPFAAAYWAIYLWLPEGLVRRGLLDSPMVVTWMIVFVLTLPQMILMWTEPDEVGEPQVLAAEGRLDRV